MPPPAHESTTIAVPRDTRMCVRNPAGFPAFSRSKPTSAPSSVAATRRSSTRSNWPKSASPAVNSCHRTSIYVPLHPEETRIHQEPVDQSSSQTDNKNQDDNHFL